MHPRLFVIMAQRSPRAVILRRGPSRWYHLIRWNTAKDEFEHGAWFNGRIYEQRCDLSPDGELFLYFALQGSRWSTSYQGAWTAVSRAPWLQALALWPEGSTWGGGGRFVADRELIVRNGGAQPHPDHPVRGLKLAKGACPQHASDGAIEGAEWSGRDHGGHAVFTREGKLFRRTASRDVELADFNALKPDPQEHPTGRSDRSDSLLFLAGVDDAPHHAALVVRDVQRAVLAELDRDGSAPDLAV